MVMVHCTLLQKIAGGNENIMKTGTVMFYLARQMNDFTVVLLQFVCNVNTIQVWYKRY